MFTQNRISDHRPKRFCVTTIFFGDEVAFKMGLLTFDAMAREVTLGSSQFDQINCVAIDSYFRIHSLEYTR